MLGGCDEAMCTNCNFSRGVLAHPKSSKTDTSSMAGLHGSHSVELLSNQVGVVGTGDSINWYSCSSGSGPDRDELGRGCLQALKEKKWATSKWRPRRGDLVRNPSNLEGGLEERNPVRPQSPRQPRKGSTSIRSGPVPPLYCRSLRTAAPKSPTGALQT